MASHRLLKAARLLHLYLGVFITPALIFFAVTGFLQTFSFHETTRGSSYKPPKLFVELGQMHKKQTFDLPQKKQPQPDAKGDYSDKAHKGSPDGAAPPKPMEGPIAKAKNLWPMKLFFALVSFGLLTSTITGIYMSYKYVRNRVAVTGTLLAGIVIPCLLTLF